MELRDALAGSALPISIDGDPVDEVIVAPITPLECWVTTTGQIRPYTGQGTTRLGEPANPDKGNITKAAYVDPWESVHKAYSFQIQEGGTYIVWYEIFDVDTPTGILKPQTLISTEETTLGLGPRDLVNVWINVNSPFFDQDKQQTFGGPFQGDNNVWDLNRLTK